MDASLVLENFFGRSRIQPVISFFVVLFRMVHKKKFSEGPAFSIGPFQQVQRELIYFTYVVRKNEKPP